MRQEKLYTYTGENGIITTPVVFENVPCVKKVRLIADDGMTLTNGTVTARVMVVGESQVGNWTEIEYKGQE